MKAKQRPNETGSLREYRNMAYTLVLTEKRSGEWWVKIVDRHNARIYAGTTPNRSKEAARGEAKLFLMQAAPFAEYIVVEKRGKAR